MPLVINNLFKRQVFPKALSMSVIHLKNKLNRLQSLERDVATPTQAWKISWAAISLNLRRGCIKRQQKLNLRLDPRQCQRSWIDGLWSIVLNVNSTSTLSLDHRISRIHSSS